MNDTLIENILRKAPGPKAPAGLTAKLKGNIVLPRPDLGEARSIDWRPLLRRWTPALSFGAFLLACLVAIAVQSNTLSELRRENGALRETTQNLEQLRQENAQHKQLVAEAQQLDQLGKDNAELARLRSEIAKLQEELQHFAALRAENQRLLGQRQATQTAAESQSGEEDPFGAARESAQRAQCVSQLKQVCLGARMWANDHNEILPPDFLTMRKELNSPKILVCPADTQRPVTSNWAEFTGSSYTILSPGASPTRPQVVYVRCPIHNYAGLVDGSVSQVSSKFTVVQNEDGDWVIRSKRQQ